jgi:NAD(P)H-hydrate epimerase
LACGATGTFPYANRFGGVYIHWSASFAERAGSGRPRSTSGILTQARREEKEQTMSEIHFVDSPAPWPERPRDAHKGSFGTVLIIAGSPGMSGAAVLAGIAALRGGAGLVKLAVPEAILPLVAVQEPCFMVRPVEGVAMAELLAQTRPDVVVCGPGLGQSEAARVRVHELLACDVPLVLDADALNMLAPADGAWRDRKAATLLTPHPGEMARLLDCTRDEVQIERVGQAVGLALRERGLVILKGARTVVTDGTHVYINRTGNPGMATGGTGDVLSGLLGALLAQRFAPFDAAVLGVLLHGLAGDLAAEHVGEVSLIATDLLETLPLAIQRYRGGKGTGDLRE